MVQEEVQFFLQRCRNIRRMKKPGRAPASVHSPDFLPMLGDLGHVQDAALLRRLEETESRQRSTAKRRGKPTIALKHQQPRHHSNHSNHAPQLLPTRTPLGTPKHGRAAARSDESAQSFGGAAFNSGIKHQAIQKLTPRFSLRPTNSRGRKREGIKRVLTEVGGGEGQESESGGCGPRGVSWWGDRDETLSSGNSWRRQIDAAKGVIRGAVIN